MATGSCTEQWYPVPSLMVKKGVNWSLSGCFRKTAQKLCPEAQGTPRHSHVVGALPATCIDPGLHEVCVWPPCSSLCLSLPCPSSSLLFAQVGLYHKAPSLCTLFFLCKGVLTPSLEHRSPQSSPRDLCLLARPSLLVKRATKPAYPLLALQAIGQATWGPGGRASISHSCREGSEGWWTHPTPPRYWTFLQNFKLAPEGH